MGVTGIGGLFFRAGNPTELSSWYLKHLRVGAAGKDGDWVWNTAAGPTVFAPFDTATDYFPADKQFMLNLRVEDLPALLADLRAAGIAVETRPEWDTPETGRFARIRDPEGNPIELWEPPPGG